MPPVARNAQPATFDHLTSHVGSLQEDKACRERNHPRRMPGASHGEHPRPGRLRSLLRTCARFVACLVRGLGGEVLADAREADAHTRGHRDRDARIAAQFRQQRWRHHRLNLAQDREPLLVDDGHGPLVGHLGIAQGIDRALHTFGQRRRVRDTSASSRDRCRYDEPCLRPARSTKKSVHRFGNLLERQAATPST